MFLDGVIQFRKNLGDQGKSYSPKKLRSLLEVTKGAHLKVQVVSFNMNLIFSSLRVPRQIYSFWINLGDQVKDRSPKRKNR